PLSEPTSNPSQPQGPADLRADTLADSVLILVALMGVQRVVGFCRAMLFCRWLDPEQLGQWNMAFGFLMLAAPLSVLALSGSFPRYAEHYRQRRQLAMLLKRVALACTGMAAVAAASIHLAQRWFSLLIFGTPHQTDLVAVLAVSLLAVIAMNFFTDLFSALRNVRLIAGLQFFNGVAFAAIAIALLAGWQCNATSVVIAYGGASALTAVGGILWLSRNWRALPGDAAPPPHREVWAKLVPFAAWVWATSFLTNLFAIADRYMILHYSTGSASEALACVGEYHSALVLPMVLTSVVAALGAIITAHLSHDWEAGRRRQAAKRLGLFLKLFGFALCVAAVLILLAAPPLFNGFFRGKLTGGLAVLPWTLTYCVWFAFLGIIHTYLLCSEKAHLTSIALALGLMVNIGLNLLLLPPFGLLGAVLATTVANLVALVLVAAFSHRLGFRIDLGACVVLAVPFLFCLGPWVTLAVLALIVLKAANSNHLLNREEKRELVEALNHYRQRFRGLRPALKPAPDPS
ncbi:MAG: lipopolysaccharide biosynthesis protein, partial [Planctomycetes bacterium]|nr:lipopolysaccharide biosynthesis protein [Planctomycetota bacterium]